MASDDSNGARPSPPIVLRIKLRYDDIEAMVQRFAANVGKSGLFLPTRSLQPIGAEIKFELRLADDTPALVGLGRVKAATPPDPQHPKATFGMAVELMRVTPQSRALILRMLEHRRASGLPDVGLPMAADIDAARRAEAAEAAREPASGPVPVVVPAAAPPMVAAPPPPAAPPPSLAVASSPGMPLPGSSSSGSIELPRVAAPPPAAAPPMVAAPPMATAPPMVAAPPPAAPPPATPPMAAASSPGMPLPGSSSSGSIELPPAEALLTAPRRTGPMAVAKVLAVSPLAPEPPRRQRLPVNEVIESASGPVASLPGAVPGLDDNVDVAAALARARALAGAGLDAELDALSEAAAAPLEISIDAASAELARQFGGTAVRRDRSAGWVTPPSTTAAGSVVDVEPAPELVAAEPVTEREPSLQPAPVTDAAEFTAERQASSEHAPLPAATNAALALAAAPELDAAPELAADPDSEPAPEPEPLGAIPDAADGDAARHAAAARSDDDEIERRLAALGADPEPVPDAVPDAVPTAVPAAGSGGEPHARSFGPSRVDPAPTEPNGPVAHARPGGGFAVAAAFAELEVDEQTEMGNAPVAGGFEPVPDSIGELATGESDAVVVDPPVPPMPPPLELGVDEFDDFEIIAEADADDEDLLASHGEQEASHRRELPIGPPGGARRGSEVDFAARLALDEDSDPYLALPSDEFSAHHVIDSLADELTGQHVGGRGAGAAHPRRPADPHLDSAGAALAMFEAGDEAMEEAMDDGMEEAMDDGMDEGTDEPLADPGSSDRFDARRIVQPIFEPDPSSSFTLAGVPSDSIDDPYDLAVARAAPAPARLVSPPAASRASESTTRPEPAILRSSPLSLHEAPVEDFELEHALEALDVDLDDLSASHAAPHAAPHAETHLQRDASRPVGASRSPAVSRTPAPQPRIAASTPAPQPRVLVPASTAGSRGASTTPLRPMRPVPGSGRVVAPRAPSESVDIDFDEDDD